MRADAPPPAEYELSPLVVHANYLINLAGANQDFYRRSIAAFHGEAERALALGAEYLVLHPGSYGGDTRPAGIERIVPGIEESCRDLDLEGGHLTLLLENTAGAGSSLGGDFEQIAELLHRLQGKAPVAACIDTCHAHVSGYDLVSDSGYESTLRQLDASIGLKHVPVWHCNDAKADRGTHLDRHQHIGRGTIGLEAFRRLLNDPRLKHAAFIAETPIDVPGDDQRNVDTLKSLLNSSKPPAGSGR